MIYFAQHYKLFVMKVSQLKSKVMKFKDQASIRNKLATDATIFEQANTSIYSEYKISYEEERT